MKSKKIIIAGGTGFIGQAIAKYFGQVNDIVILTRQTSNTKNNFYSNKLVCAADGYHVRYLKWDGKHTEKHWANEIDGADIIINLAGKSVNCRYTKKNKQEIFESRVNATKALGEAIRNSTIPPKLWINAASATIYRHAEDKPQNEYSGEIENDFSIQVCKRWEETFSTQRTPFTRKVALRMAITLGAGGVIVPFFNLLKFGLGGRQGSGKQMVSWVHVEDVCRTIEWAYNNSAIEGVFNCCSPNPVSNSVFMQTLRKITNHKIGLPAFTLLLKLGAPLIGTETELILKSRWVVPTKLLQAGFRFKYANLGEALKEIVSNTPRSKYHLF